MEAITKSLSDFNQNYFYISREIMNKIFYNSLGYIVISILILSTTILGYALYQGVEINLIPSTSNFGNVFITVGYIILAFKVAFMLFLFFTFLKYKPIEGIKDHELPECTVVIPAYNEGRLVYKTIHSLSNSDYPKDKIQLIAIDDGSEDDTWEWMKKAKKDLKDGIIILQQPKNMGKREALYRAFKEITTEVVITVDSDSIVEKNTIRNIVSPFVVNDKCGAVAGNVKVLNTEEGIIPKMLNVSFAFSFEFIRSAQSVYGSVLCTPGALSAYRKEAVDNCLEKWFNQKFLGKRTQIGEDRAMTNMILKQGYDVNFQSNANVITEIPKTYQKLSKMFIRWERSNVRENIMMSKFAFQNFRSTQKWPSRLLLINQWVKMITAYPSVVFMLIFLVLKPFLFIGVSLFSILIFASIPALFYYLKYSNINQSLLSYSYSVFYAFSLFWITPYAIATAGQNGWLTRAKINNKHKQQK
ncbi:glycosyltransferase [Psychroflexus sp. MBR-150]|jgi:hyaluronan synthase